MKLPQLHLGDLFWLVLVVALGLGWWIEHRTRTAYFRQAIYGWDNDLHKMRMKLGELGYTIDEGTSPGQLTIRELEGP